MMNIMGGDQTASLNPIPMDQGASMLMGNPSMGLIVPPQPTANLGLNPGALTDFN